MGGVNRQQDHLSILPEDDKLRSIALGALNVIGRQNRVEVLKCAGGWAKVFAALTDRWQAKLLSNRCIYLVLLMDFDGDIAGRRSHLECLLASTPELQRRVFLLGPRGEAEDAQREAEKRPTDLGEALATECRNRQWNLWNGPQFCHNNTEVQRLLEIAGGLLF